MSQIFNPNTSGVVPPSVATTYITDNGNAVPTANQLFILGRQSDESVDDGIQVEAVPPGDNTIIVELTNRATDQVVTSDATPTNLLSLDLSVFSPGVFVFTAMVTAYNTTTPSGASYFITSGVRSDGVTATEIGTEFTSEFEEIAMEDSDVSVNVSGLNIDIDVTGIAASTIYWDCLLNFRLVTAL